MSCHAVAAFGGVVPDPVSGKPDPSAARFGTELSYDALALPWQPHLALTAHGSTWNGELDERRLSAAVSASAGDTWLDGWAEAQAFASTNPWGASAVELTGAGATAQWRRDGRQLGLDVTYLRPERSLRLAAALPLEELCVPASQIGDGAVTCPGGEWWASASASAGLRRRRWALDAIVSVAHSRSETSSTTRSAALRGEREVGPVRVEAGVSAGKVAFASFTAAELGAAFAPARHLDVALRYRPELLDYVASEGPVLMHSVIAEGRASPQPSLDLAASVVATTGEDRDAVALMLFVAWRPLP
ncbi:MAG TPA: hypothetical protein PKU97_21120 [Kofleriaceae bacterium]|nr:hypothetical protein [Kofleriaceae bacterium]